MALRPDLQGLRPGLLGLQQVLAYWASSLAWVAGPGWRGEGLMYGQMGNLPTLLYFVPYLGRRPKRVS